MHRFRRIALIRLVLALVATGWLGIAVSAVVAPTRVASICSATKLAKLRVLQADGAPVSDTGGLQHLCPLCMTPALPVVSLRFDHDPVGAPTHRAPRPPHAREADPVGAPLPARGPPGHS
jgi:hypothetical protein